MRLFTSVNDWWKLHQKVRNLRLTALGWITKSLVGPLAQSREFLYGSLVRDWVGVWKEFSLKPVEFSRTYKTIPKPIAELRFKNKKHYGRNKIKDF